MYKGYDNESGCEIAWKSYTLDQISLGKCAFIILLEGIKSTNNNISINYY